MLAALILAAEEADPTRVVLPHKEELIFGAIAFFLLFFVLSKVAFPKLNEMLSERSNKIREGLEKSEQAKTEAEQLLEQYRRQLDEARGDAQKIIEEAKRTAESMRQELASKAEKEAQDIVTRARTDVQGEAERAKQQLRAELATLSLELARRVIERELSQPENAREFVERTIQELAATGGSNGGNGHSS
jgi:F-type H+-transporting ATPase subunit b